MQTALQEMESACTASDAAIDRRAKVLAELEPTIAQLQPVPHKPRPWLFRLGAAVAIASAFAAGAFLF